MTDEFEWAAAEEALYQTSEEQFARFLGRPDRGDVYGFGFFCDPIEGVMPVANTRSFHDSSFREYVEAGGMSDEATFKWDIGNWEYPAGLACSTDDQIEFDARWDEFRGPLSKMFDGDTPGLLEVLCVRVLKRLCAEGVFSGVRGFEGFIVLGPDDSVDDVLAKKRRIDSS